MALIFSTGACSPGEEPDTPQSPLPTAASAYPPAVIQGAALADTWITPDEPDVNFGDFEMCHLQGSWTPDRLLYLPDLSALPPGAAVAEAKLEIYAYDADQPATVAVYHLLAGWDAMSATYNAPWTAPGLEPGTDHDPTPLSTFAAPGAGWLTLDVTSAVQRWVAGEPNHGLVVRITDEGGHHYRVYMSDYLDDPTLQPRLTVSFVGGSTSSRVQAP